VSTRVVRAGVAALLAGALILAGCGKQDPGGGVQGAGGAQGSGGPKFLADTAPWPTAPGAEGWELASWMPLGAQVEARRVDPAFLREHGSRMHTQSLWFETVGAWRRWVSEAGLPSDGLADVIIVSEPVAFSAYLPRLGEQQVVARLLEQGWREQALEGVRAFVPREGESPVAAWIDGRLVLVSYEAGALERVIALRKGREPSARTLAGVEAGLKAVGAGLPVEIETAQDGLKNGPPGAPPMLASIGRIEAGPDPSEVRALVMRSPAEVEQLRSTLEKLFADVPLEDDQRPHVGARDTVLRLKSPGKLERLGRSFDGSIHNDLGALKRALDSYRQQRGAFPTTSEGLAALAGIRGGLDEFLGALPKDPWGRPYAYQPEHPKRPDGYVLRSLGPDGELDTEDDVLPE